MAKKSMVGIPQIFFLFVFFLLNTFIVIIIYFLWNK